MKHFVNLELIISIWFFFGSVFETREHSGVTGNVWITQV